MHEPAAHHRKAENLALYRTDPYRWLLVSAALAQAGEQDKISAVAVADAARIELIQAPLPSALAEGMAFLRTNVRDDLYELLRKLIRWAGVPRCDLTAGYHLTRIDESRNALHDTLRASPSLRLVCAELLPEVFASAYQAVRKRHTLPPRPAACPWALDDLLAEGFYPRPIKAEEGA